MTPQRRPFRWLIAGLCLAAGIGLLTQFWWPINAAPPQKKAASHATGDRADSSTVMRVATVRPQASSAPRQTSLPCSAHWYDYADLYAKVSGYLEEMKVDIGSRVQQGDVVAVIDVPELEHDVHLAAATLQHTKASTRQTLARKKSAMAEQRAAEAACLKAEADLARWTAEQTFREKEYQRFRELNQSESVQTALVDEKLFQLQSVQAGRRSGETAILTAKEQASAAAARVELAEADYEVAQAQVQIAEAGLAKAKEYASFAQIVSPYDGVVTARHFHRGEFIRAADKGGVEPLVKVGRTDKIRVVVHIPDGQVPYAHVGDPVTIRFDSLPGRTFDTTLARIAYSEDVSTRTMRAEADLSSEDGAIVDQMYGQMQIRLEPASQSLTLPSVCLVGDMKEGKGKVFVIAAGVAALRTVSIGAHDGVAVEILEGLTAADDVVHSPPAGLSEGTAVSSQSKTAP